MRGGADELEGDYIGACEEGLVVGAGCDGGDDKAEFIDEVGAEEGAVDFAAAFEEHAGDAEVALQFFEGQGEGIGYDVGDADAAVVGACGRRGCGGEDFYHMRAAVAGVGIFDCAALPA